MEYILFVPILLTSSMAFKGASPPQIQLPPINPALLKEGEQNGVSKIFKIWDSFASTELADQLPGENGTFTLFTVDDDTWSLHLLSGRADPFLLDPVLQRLVISTQLVKDQVTLTEPAVIKTVGGRSLVLSQEGGGEIHVNDVPIKKKVIVGNSQLCILEKLLFIRPE